jgi:uncharacterized membrane protein YbhN (UPF0104 family)
MKSRALLFRILRLGAAVVLVWLAVRALRSDWSSREFLAILSRASIPWLSASVVVIGITYGATIEAWRRAVHDQGWRLSFWKAARIVCVANLGKYVPGRVWAIAGAGLLAKDEGIPSAVAIGITLLLQVVTLATGMIAAAVLAPNELARLGSVTAPVSGALGAMVLASSALLVVPPIREFLDSKVSSIAKRLPRIHFSTWMVVVALSITVWCGFGAALMLMERSLSGSEAIPFSIAAGAFSASYVLGFIALLTPAGIGPREAAFVVLLAPTLGPVQAAALAVVSRVAITMVDVATALPFLKSLARGRAETDLDQKSLFSDEE